jgi:hypothetical protein
VQANPKTQENSYFFYSRKKKAMKKFNILLLVLSIWVLGNCLLAPTDAEATIRWNVSKDESLYGHLNQNNVPGWGSYACGPTSVVNSFVYLQNAYEAIYDNKLVPGGDLISVVETLGLDAYMKTKTDETTYVDRLAYGKHKYIEEKVPGVTLYSAESMWGWYSPGSKPDWYETYTTPTKNFLYDELKKCADVEILFQGGAAHYVTVCSFDWMDGNGNATIDRSECTIDYIDPWVGAWGNCKLWEQGGRMYTDYAGESWIGAVITEIPEPATVLLLGLGGLALLRMRRQGS